jgi:hypothetical protein
MKIVISPKFEWMRPYLEAGSYLLPPGKSITRLGYWSLNGKYGKNSHAAIITNDDLEHRVYMKDMYQRRNMTHPAPFSKIDLLKTLAHEMAHTADWEHTPAHGRLEAQLSALFMYMLEKEGYQSEEKELGHIP